MSEQPRTTAGTTNAPQNVAATSEARPFAPRSKGSAGNVLTPIDIMNKRQAREAAKEAARRAEAGEIEEAGRSYEDNQRRSMERQRTQAALTGGYSGPARVVMESQLQGPSPPIPGDVGRGGLEVPRPAQPRAAPQPSQQARITPTLRQAQLQQEPVIAPVTSDQPQTSQGGAPSFPHAFERWEELSGKWEGLTSYWIRRLETNRRDIQGEPSWAQAQREITDLAAAGANLFHAVVELQRLRASSERKFQRWFYQTREQQEEDKETIGRLQRALEEEQNARLNAPSVNIDLLENRLSEMRREQQISLDEAKRSWEELGRREQADREIQAALRQGQAVMIGGIQVVPTHAGPSRPVYQQYVQPQIGVPQLLPSQHATPIQQTAIQSPGTFEQQDRPSPTDTDPFSGQSASQFANRPQTSYGFQPFPSGPSPPPIGSLRSLIPEPGMSPARSQHGYSSSLPYSLPQQQQQYHAAPQQYSQPAQQYYSPQQYPTIPQQYPFPAASGIPATAMPFYNQAGPYLQHPSPQAIAARPPEERYQPYIESEGASTSELGADAEGLYENEPSNIASSPPSASAPSRHPLPTQYPRPQHEHQTSPGSPEQTFLPKMPSSPQELSAVQPRPATSFVAPTAEEEGDSSYIDEPSELAQGQGYGSEAAQWQGIAAHGHHATRLSDVLEATEEESLRTPTGSASARSSRVPGT